MGVSGSMFDMSTGFAVVFSMGTAQVTYIITAPIGIYIGMRKTIKQLWKTKLGTRSRIDWDKVRRSWKFLGFCSVCLMPIVGGFLAVKLGPF